ncbi:MAG: hypothetical protein KKB50_06020 [Planctomycetes bacterium]|nr:hypothetical protein [Planctomycetota bacterium]
MPPTPQSATDLVPHLRQCGYGDDQLALPFEFNHVTVPVVAFAGKPWNSWSACIAAVDVDGDSRTSAAQVNTLGVPTVFVCHSEIFPPPGGWHKKRKRRAERFYDPVAAKELGIDENDL